MAVLQILAPIGVASYARAKDLNWFQSTMLGIGTAILTEQAVVRFPSLRLGGKLDRFVARTTGQIAIKAIRIGISTGRITSRTTLTVLKLTGKHIVVPVVRATASTAVKVVGKLVVTPARIVAARIIVPAAVAAAPYVAATAAGYAIGATVGTGIAYAVWGEEGKQDAVELYTGQVGWDQYWSTVGAGWDEYWK